MDTMEKMEVNTLYNYASEVVGRGGDGRDPAFVIAKDFLDAFARVHPEIFPKPSERAKENYIVCKTRLHVLWEGEINYKEVVKQLWEQRESWWKGEEQIDGVES